jgi:hypothetical protein
LATFDIQAFATSFCAAKNTTQLRAPKRQVITAGDAEIDADRGQHRPPALRGRAVEHHHRREELERARRAERHPAPHSRPRRSANQPIRIAKAMSCEICPSMRW